MVEGNIIGYPNELFNDLNVARHLDRWERELGHVKLSRLIPSLIAEVRDRMRGEHIRPNQLRSGSTVSKYIASLSHVLSTAVREWQWLHENPCFKVKKPETSPGRTRYLSKEEIHRLSNACKESQNKDLFLIFLIALTSGARKSEILGLKGEDLDMENRLFLLCDTKNSTNRSLPMSDQVFEMLKSGLQRRQGRNDAKSACWAVSKNSQFSNFGFLAGHVGRQNTPVVLTPTKKTPSYSVFLSIKAW